MVGVGPLKAVVFDLDGTLADSQSGIISSYRHTLAGFGLTATDDDIRACIGPPLRISLARLGVPETQLDEAVALYREYFGTTGILDNRAFAGIPAMLAELASSGLALGLATSKLQLFADRIVAMFGVDHLFESVAGASADGSRLSKTAILGHALVGLGSPDPATAAMIGDRADDMMAAAALGAVAVGVTWGYGSREELIGAGAGVLVDTPTGLSRLLLAASR
jgi:phosphoglycolate phosphatase